MSSGKEHFNFGLYSTSLLVAGFAVGRLDYKFTYKEISEFMLGVCIGLWLPDIDHEKTLIGRSFPLIPWLHKKHKQLAKWRDARREKKGKPKIQRDFIFKHGGITHTIFVNAWIMILAYINRSMLGAGISFGYATHLYIDDLTGNKLPMMWWPLKTKRGWFK